MSEHAKIGGPTDRAQWQDEDFVFRLKRTLSRLELAPTLSLGTSAQGTSAPTTLNSSGYFCEEKNLYGDCVSYTNWENQTSFSRSPMLSLGLDLAVRPKALSQEPGRGRWMAGVSLEGAMGFSKVSVRSTTSFWNLWEGEVATVRSISDQRLFEGAMGLFWGGEAPMVPRGPHKHELMAVHGKNPPLSAQPPAPWVIGGLVRAGVRVPMVFSTHEGGLLDRVSPELGIEIYAKTPESPKSPLGSFLGRHPVSPYLRGHFLMDPVHFKDSTLMAEGGVKVEF